VWKVEFKGKPCGFPLNLAKAGGETLFNKKEEGKVAYGEEAGRWT
jgi:hypothetical protein